MKNNDVMLRLIIVTVGLLFAKTACAFDFGNMMNPSKWMGGDKDDKYSDGYYGGPGGYGGPGYGAPDYGPGYGAPGYGPGSGYGGGDPGYGAPGYGTGTGYGGADPGYGAPPGYGLGYGAPGHGYRGAPGYGGTPAYGAPGQGAREAEIKRLEDRLRELKGQPR